MNEENTATLLQMTENGDINARELEAALQNNTYRRSRTSRGEDSQAGMWEVKFHASDSTLNHTFVSTAGLFKTREEAEKYAAAYDAATLEASAFVYNIYDNSTTTSVEFVPFKTAEVFFTPIYTVQTYREQDSKERTVDEISVNFYTDEEISKYTSEPDGKAMAFLMENKDSAFLELMDSQDIDRTATSSEFLSPVDVGLVENEFSDMSLIYESFVTLHPKNVVLYQK